MILRNSTKGEGRRKTSFSKSIGNHPKKAQLKLENAQNERKSSKFRLSVYLSPNPRNNIPSRKPILRNKNARETTQQKANRQIETESEYFSPRISKKPLLLNRNTSKWYSSSQQLEKKPKIDLRTMQKKQQRQKQIQPKNTLKQQDKQENNFYEIYGLERNDGNQMISEIQKKSRSHPNLQQYLLSKQTWLKIWRSDQKYQLIKQNERIFSKRMISRE